MALQPAAGARDLNPRQVEGNRRIRQQLAEIYRCWGYREVDPPTVETLDTLAAGGGIAGHELVRLASDDPLGLRPELTASIARAACTRMAGQPVPLRLWADGDVFRRTQGEGGGQRINQAITSGVELLGETGPSADVELIRLLLAAAGSLGLKPTHKPTLLVGHHGVLVALLAELPEAVRHGVRRALTSFDPLSLQTLDLSEAQRLEVQSLLGLRGHPETVLAQLRARLGPNPLVEQLAAVLQAVAPAAARHGVRLQLDPTFQPHFNLYDGVVLKLVCQGQNVPAAIASGGRYDALVGRFSTDESRRTMPAAGVGFGFDVEQVRELVQPALDGPTPVLVAFEQAADLTSALDALEQLHSQGQSAELLSTPAASRQDAESVAAERGCSGVHWLGR